MARNATTDVRTDSMKIAMAEHFADYEAEYREEDNHTVVYEDDECVIVADHTGHELNEWASDYDVDREDLRAFCRQAADSKMGEQDAHEAFSHSDPLVFDRFEDN